MAKPRKFSAAFKAKIALAALRKEPRRPICAAGINSVTPSSTSGSSNSSRGSLYLLRHYARRCSAATHRRSRTTHRSTHFESVPEARLLPSLLHLEISARQEPRLPTITLPGQTLSRCQRASDGVDASHIPLRRREGQTVCQSAYGRCPEPTVVAHLLVAAGSTRGPVCGSL